MKKFSFQPPYKNGKTTFASTIKKSGVYIIKKNGKIVYIGYSGTNLYKTLYRHFESWNDKQYRVTYQSRLHRDKFTVRVIICSPARSQKLEGALILKHQPRDNENKYAGYVLDASDKRIIDQYEQIPVERDAPF